MHYSMDYLERNRNISMKIMEELKKIPEVEGVMFLGGVARNFADVDSDIDLAVFSNEKLPNLSVGENFDENNIDIEFWNIKLNESFEEWGQVQKEAYQEGIIVFDRNGKVKDYIDKTLFYSDKTFLLEFGERFFHLAWHGLIYTPYRNKSIRGYHWILPSDLWYKRNNPENGFVILQNCSMIFIELLFVLNRRWIPDFKWIWIKSQKLSTLPNNYYEKMKFILFSEFNDENWDKKIMLFQELLDETYEMFEQTGILPNDLYSLVVHEYE